MEIRIWLIALLVVVWTGDAFAQTKLKVAYPTTVGSMAVIWVAKEARLFEKHGLEVELIYVAGSSKVVQAMLAREIPISEIAIPAVIQANLAGADLVMLAGPNHKPGQKLMVKPEIKAAENLKGKKIGITRFGTSDDSCFVTCWDSGKYSRIATSHYCKWEDRRRSWRDWAPAALMAGCCRHRFIYELPGSVFRCSPI